MLASAATAQAATPVPTPGQEPSLTAFLHAQERLDGELLAALPAVKAAGAAYLEGLRSGCPGVLASVRVPSLQEGLAEPTSRAAGEAARRYQQAGVISEELLSAERASTYAPLVPAETAYAQTLESLRLGSHGAEEVRTEELAATRSLLSEAEVLPVCSDLSAWVASGQQRLAAASKALRAEREHGVGQGSSPQTLLVGGLALTELGTLTDHALLDRVLRLTREASAGLEAAGETESAHEAELIVALEAPASGRREDASALREHRLGFAPLAPAGDYDAEVVEDRLEAACPVSLSVTLETDARTLRHSACLSGHPTAPAQVRCEGGLRVVEARLAATVRRVLLTRSAGSPVRSPTLAIPAADGGPASLYVQALYQSQIPLTLTELDAAGHTLARVRLPRAHACVSRTQRPVPHDDLTLARGNLPEGPPFKIRTQASLIDGQLHVFVLSELGEGYGGEYAQPGGAHLGELRWAVADGCAPHPYALIYGVVRVPGAEVLGRVGGTLQKLTTITPPARLKLGGAFFYEALPLTLEALVIRNQAGMTVLEEPLSTNARRAYCEGLSEEPGSIAPGPLEKREGGL